VTTAHRERVDAFAEQGKKRRHDEDGDQRCQQGDRGAGDGHRVEEALGEEPQCRHGHRNREAGEHGGAAGGEHHRAMSLAGRAA